MSFLAEILSSAETVELQEMIEKIPEFKTKIEALKVQIVEYMENVYLNFSARPKQNKKMFTEVKSMEEEIISLKTKMENVRKKQLTEASVNVEKLTVDLERVNLTLDIVSKACEMNEQLVKFNELFNNNDFFSAMKLICQLEKLDNQINENDQLNLKDISLTVLRNKCILVDKLEVEFSEHIKVDCKTDNCVTLRIKENGTNLENALKALYYNYTVISCLSTFSSSLWEHFIIPVVDNAVTITNKKEKDCDILEIVINPSESKPLHQIVFSNLLDILKFLKTHIDFELVENFTVMTLIGDDLRDNLSELIIKRCLQDTIPATTEDLQNYKVVIQETEEFEKTLQTYNIFEKNANSLTEYVNNVDVHYIQKKCNEYKLQSENIMKKDLHDMKEVGIPYNPENPLDSSKNQLPHCCVSKSAIELMQFLEEIMTKASSAAESCASELLYTIEFIVKKYGQFIPQYHSKLLQTIPQQVALFQNNCLFIYYELTNWKEKYFSTLPPQFITAYDFIKAAHQLQQIGIDSFTSYVSKTKDSLVIVGIIGPTLEDLSPETEKSVRQCMRQQELLKTVWHKVLSYPVYNKTIGTLLDTMCLNLINSVVCLEDISSKSAEQLVDVFKIVITRGPKLFTDPKEINLFVPSWYKLNELNFVLAASLVDISDRWADGKGPLALQFKQTEMKSLIRALFQNTDRRAAVLARI